MKVRSQFWDNYKGILILLVVLGHFIYSYAVNIDDCFANEVFKFIYIFHMPAFIFCAGHLSKSINARSARSLLKLFLYYMIFNTLMMLFANLYMGAHISLLTPYYSYWYIIAIIAWRVIASCIGDFKGIVVFSLAVALLAGFWDLSNVLANQRIIAFMFFFMLGYKLDKAKVKNLIENRNWKIYLGGCIMLIAGLAVAYVLIYRTDVTLGMLMMAKYRDFTGLGYRIAIIATALLAIGSMICLLPNRKIPFLTQIGRNSLFIFLVHRFITIIYYKELFAFGDYTKMFTVYAFVAAIITCAVLGIEKLNVWFNSKIDNLSNALMDTENKSNTARVILLIVFVLILCFAPLCDALESVL